MAPYRELSTSRLAGIKKDPEFGKSSQTAGILTTWAGFQVQPAQLIAKQLISLNLDFLIWEVGIMIVPTLLSYKYQIRRYVQRCHCGVWRLSGISCDIDAKY